MIELLLTIQWLYLRYFCWFHANSNYTFFVADSNKNIDFPTHVYNIPCGDNSSLPELISAGLDKNGDNATITAKLVGFVSLEISDLDTGEKLTNYEVGVIRPPEQIQDKVKLFLISSILVHACLDPQFKQ